MFKWLTTTFQFAGLMALSGQAFASGLPSAALYLSYIPILAYLICAVIWVLKFKKWSAAKRSLLVIFIFPFFSMFAFFIPILFVSQNKYLEIVLSVSSVVLTVMVIGIFWGSIAKNRQQQ